MDGKKVFIDAAELEQLEAKAKAYDEAQKQEPFAYYDFQGGGFYFDYRTKICDIPVTVEVKPMKLFSKPIPAQPEPSGAVVPDGWQFVPIKPTEAMLDAADRCLMTPLSGMSRGCGPSRVFAAMLAAAPKPEGETN